MSAAGRPGVRVQAKQWCSSIVSLVLQNLCVSGIQLDVPLHALGVANFNLIDVAAVLFFQLGVFSRAAWVQRQRCSVEFFEGLDSPGVTQFECFIRTLVTGLSQASSQGQGSSGKYGSQWFHVQIP